MREREPVTLRHSGFRAKEPGADLKGSASIAGAFRIAARGADLVLGCDIVVVMERFPVFPPGTG